MGLKENTLAIIINAGNEEEMIADCLRSVAFADELVFVAANSTDNTLNIAKNLCPQAKFIRVSDSYGQNFAKWHNIGLQNAASDWVLHLDADERITPKLRREIKNTISHPKHHYYAIPRTNHFLGQRVKYGGTYPDYVKRLFERSRVKGWVGQIHEQPLIEGAIGYLKNDLLHFTHRNLTSMLQKSILWTDVEARALVEANHPPIVWWRIIRMMLTKLWQRLIRQQMWRDGTVGWISVIFEVFDTFLIYARTWELQKNAAKSRYL